MPSRTPQVTPFLPVLCAVAATLLFVASSGLHSFARGLCLGAGLAMLVLAVVYVSRLRSSTLGNGWLPSRESTSREPANRESRSSGGHEEPDNR